MRRPFSAQVDNGHFSKLLKLQNETHKKKNKDVVLLCCHEHVLETMSVVLHGISHPAQSSRVRGSQEPYGFKGTKNLRVSGSRGIESLPRLTGAF